MAQYVTYQLTQDETDVVLAGVPDAIDALRMHIAQALREAGDPSHVDVLMADGTVACTLDIH